MIFQTRSLKVNEYNRVFVGEYTADTRFPFYNSFCFKDIKPGEGEGTMAFFISPTQKTSAVTVTRGNEVVHVGMLSKNASKETIEQLKGFKLDQDRSIEEGLVWRTLVDQLLGEDALYAEYLKYYRSESRQVAYRLFSGLALGTTSDMHLEKAKKSLSENGFYNILNNGDQIRMLAKVSLAGSIIHDYSRLKENIGKNTRFDDFIDELRAVQNETDVHFFWKNREFIGFFV